MEFKCFLIIQNREEKGPYTNPSMSLMSQQALDLDLTQMMFSSLNCFLSFLLSFFFSSFVSPAPLSMNLSDISEPQDDKQSLFSSESESEDNTESDFKEGSYLVSESVDFLLFCKLNCFLFSFSTYFKNRFCYFYMSLILSSWDSISSCGLKVWMIIDLKSFDSLKVALYLSKIIGIPFTV